jgi:hypothetical protein
VGTDPTKPLNLSEVIKILIKHFDLHEGLFDLSFEMQIGVGNFGPTKESTFPSAVVGIGGLKLIKSDKMGPHTVDASMVNPLIASSPKKKSIK